VFALLVAAIGFGVGIGSGWGDAEGIAASVAGMVVYWAAIMEHSDRSLDLRNEESPRPWIKPTTMVVACVAVAVAVILRVL
jgi:hypothetical protein